MSVPLPASPHTDSERAAAVLDRWDARVQALKADGENGSLIDDALPRLVAALRGVLALADGDIGTPHECSPLIAPIEIHDAVAAALTDGTPR